MRDLIKKILLKEVGSKRSKDTDIIYRDSKVVVLVPKSHESSRSFSRGTQYCTGGDCHNEKATGNMFKSHTKAGDDLFRIFFKDGTKVRLTWMGDGRFNWGLGRKEDYHTFGGHNFGDKNNPFNFDELNIIKLEQEILKPKADKFEKWAKRFLKKRGYDGYADIWQSKYDGDGKDYKRYSYMYDKITGGDSYWWNEGKDTLFMYMNKLPSDAITKMNKYHNA